MARCPRPALAAFALSILTLVDPAGGQTRAPAPAITEGDYVIPSYRFRSGETLEHVRLHYRTIGTPLRDASGKVRNGVLIMHGSSGDASQVLAPSMREPLNPLPCRCKACSRAQSIHGSSAEPIRKLGCPRF